MFRYRFRFKAAGRAWLVDVKSGFTTTSISLLADGVVQASLTYPSGEPEALDTKVLSVETPQGVLIVQLGYIGWMTLACQAHLAGARIYRSHKREFAPPLKLRAFLERQQGSDSDERKAMQARAQARMPAVYVDLSLAVVFFLIASRTPDWEFQGLPITGLQTAAVSGAAITLALFIVQRFVKVDLLGGFAVFGMVMALISAGLALAFQDDLFIKLRGAVVGGIAASLFLTDWAFGGRYLGQRMALYAEQFLRLRPARASLALGLSGLVLAAIDVPAAFVLPHGVWLVYNSFLDTLIAIPLVLGALYLARDRGTATPGPGAR